MVERLIVIQVVVGSSPISQPAVARWCNGNTLDFGSSIRGSNPRRAENYNKEIPYYRLVGGQYRVLRKGAYMDMITIIDKTGIRLSLNKRAVLSVVQSSDELKTGPHSISVLLMGATVPIVLDTNQFDTWELRKLMHALVGRAVGDVAKWIYINNWSPKEN